AWRLEKRPAASYQSIQPETLSLMGPAARSGLPSVASGVQPQWSTWREALAIVCFRPQLRRTVLIALIVGSVIFSIKQLDALLQPLAAAAWWATVGNARDMGAMVQGVAGVGIAMPFDMTALVFMGMWTTMMVAMMFPTTAPIVLLHRMVVRRRGEGAAPTIAFGLGYLVICASVGVIPLAVLLGFRHFSAHSMWIDRVGGSVLLVAGVYQFSHWKETCLRACRTPLTFLMTHDFGRGSMGAFRVGLSHGLYCLGCCWALMAE